MIANEAIKPQAALVLLPPGVVVMELELVPVVEALVVAVVVTEGQVKM